MNAQPAFGPGRRGATRGWLTVAGAVAAIVAAVTAAFLVGPAHGDVTAFFRIGSGRPLPPRVAALHPTVFADEVGYDGQFYLALALDPLLRDPGTVAGLDNPRLRARRMLFPTLGWMLAGGVPRLVPWTLVLLNLASFVALAAIVARVAAASGRSPWCGVLVLAPVGCWITLLLGTTDLLAGALVAFAVVASLEGRERRGAAAAGLALLAREVNVVVLVALWIASRRRRTPHGGRAYLVAAGPAVAWNLWLIWRLPATGSSSGLTENLGPPLVGMFRTIRHLAAATSPRLIFEAALLVSLLLAAWAAVAHSHAWTRESAGLGLTGAAFAGVLIVAGTPVLGYFVGSMRVFLPLFVLALIGFARFGRAGPPLRIALAVQGAASILFLATRLAPSLLLR